MRNLSIAEAQTAARSALEAAGASPEHAASVARASVDAESEGISGHGLRHLTYYLSGLQDGRINGTAEPAITHPATTIIASDAKSGFAHTPFDRIFDNLVETTLAHGTGLFCQTNAFTCGALGTFVRRLAECGIMALAATNGGPAIVASPGASAPTYCTNPIAFAVPRADAAPLVIDQASSQMAMSTIRERTETGEQIPDGIAVDEHGEPTADPAAALKGMLLAFGGARGANIALMVELLSAGLSGGNWSLDAPSYASGNQSPGSSLTILCVNPHVLAPNYDQRIDTYLTRINTDHSVYIPGLVRAKNRQHAIRNGIAIPADIEKLIGLDKL